MSEKKPPRRKLEAALRAALPHVYRQQDAGRHEQDRQDAFEFFQAHKEVVEALKTWAQ